MAQPPEIESALFNLNEALNLVIANRGRLISLFDEIGPNGSTFNLLSPVGRQIYGTLLLDELNFGIAELQGVHFALINYFNSLSNQVLPEGEPL